jgi:hypothetical protein
MKFLLWSTLFVEALLFCSTVSFGARPNSNAQLLGALFSLLLFGLCLTVFVCLFLSKHRAYRLKLAGVLLLAPVSVVLAFCIGGVLREHLFYRDLPRLKQVVSLVQSGAARVVQGHVMLPSQYNDLASTVHAKHAAKGELIVTFFVGGGFPVKHHCYVYCSSDNSALVQKDWPIGYRKEKQWFEVND